MRPDRRSPASYGITRLPAGEGPDRINKPAGERIVAYRYAKLRMFGVLHQAAGHLGGLLGLGPVVEVDGRERQQQWMQRRRVLRPAASD